MNETMITLGIDMASQAKKTAACLIKWNANEVVIYDPYPSCSNELLKKLIDKNIRPCVNGIEQPDVFEGVGCYTIGIDAPFGWPLPFAKAVKQWLNGEKWEEADWDIASKNATEPDIRRKMRLRATDLEVTQKTSLTPLSVSSDKIALPAMRTIAILQHYGVENRSGDGRFYEVYPAASLEVWGMRYKGYKDTSGDSVVLKKEKMERRCEMLRELRRAIQASHVGVQIDGDLDKYASSDHVLDALVAALTTRAATSNHTEKPSQERQDLAIQEGWIHLPKYDIERCLVA